MISWRKSFDDDIGSFCRKDGGTTGEDIGGGVAVFRPGVNSEMRFGNDDDATNALRAELVERFSQDSSAASYGSSEHNFSDGFEVIKKFAVAIIEFY
jgi:hypothetical protein